MGVTDFLLLSCLGFAITAHAQDCAVPVGGPNMHLKDEDILKDSFASGDRATFECDVGYLYERGSPSITCTAGSWSTVSLECQRKNCGSPGEVPNGHIHYPKENLFGDHIEITCFEGYRLVGKSTITCGAEGWMDRLPRCEVATCDEAPQVKDATFTPYKEPYDFGDVVQYSCQKGFTLSGSASISCSDDGTFKPDPPTCTKVQCEDLDIPDLDWMSGSRPPHGHKATVTYKCRTGFRMVGQPTLTCEINSQWSPGLPTCESISCEEPHIKHGYLTHDARPPYRPNDRVKFECSTGYKMKGNPTLTCQADGQWSPAPPECSFDFLVLLYVGIALHVLAAICYILNRSGVGARIWRCLTNRRRKCLEGNDTSAEQEESLQDVRSRKEHPPGNVAASGGTVDKPPVMSTNEV